jgi:3-oxoacyl-ACP reductase-like protein
MGFNYLSPGCNNSMKTILFFLLSIAVVTGCKKSQSTENTPAPQTADTATSGAPTPSAPAPANPPAAQAAPAPTVDTTKAFADVNSALKARDYKKATDTLLAVQRMPQLTEQQSQALHGQMVQLQGAVAAGVASGDPNAKAAADRLRASASGN